MAVYVNSRRAISIGTIGRLVGEGRVGEGVEGG